MATDEFGEKTEQATDHRRQEERRKGNVARSSELAIAGHVAAAAAVLWVLGRDLVDAIGRLLVNRILEAGNATGDEREIVLTFYDMARWATSNVLPWLGVLFLAAIAINVLQVGWLVSTEKLAPDINAINPINGLKRIFSIRGLVTLGISLLKLGLLTSAAAWLIWTELSTYLLLTDASVVTTVSIIGMSVLKLGALLTAILLVIGLSDFGFQKWKHEQDIMMTKEEIKREMKDMEGDPLIRRRRRDAHQKLIEARDVRKVSLATFMTVNPTHYAIAFRYEPPNYPVPTVIVKGTDEMALAMREVAMEHNVPIIERPELTRKLYATLEVGQSIPIDLYDVFVEILKYVYTVTGKTIDARHVEDVAA
jgi:flagellar biosynthetic protein FlhB